MTVDITGLPVPPQQLEVEVNDDLQTSTDGRDLDYSPEPVPIDAYEIVADRPQFEEADQSLVDDRPEASPVGADLPSRDGGRTVRTGRTGRVAEGEVTDPRTGRTVRTGQFPEGEELLDEVEGIVTRYVAFPDPHHAPIVAAWIAHCHLIDAFDTTPRLAILSPEKGSGKTRLLEVLEPLLPRADMMLSPSASVLFRSIDAAEGHYAILLDECDATLGLKRLSDEQEQVRAIVNAGYRRGGSVARNEPGPKGNWVPKMFAVFGPVALAGIGDLPDTILDRAVIIPMKRRRPTDRVQPLRERDKAKLYPTRDALTAWAEGLVDLAVTLDDDLHFLPEGIEDRLADVYGPLIITAAVAGDRWHERVVDAAQHLIESSSARTASFGVQLLGDIRDVFNERAVEQLTTADLLDALHAIESAPWGDLRGAPIDERFLARKLKPYDVFPRKLNLGGDKRGRGYHLLPDTDGQGGLADAFTRYLPQEAEPTVRTVRTPSPDQAVRTVRTEPATGSVPPVPDVPHLWEVES